MYDIHTKRKSIPSIMSCSHLYNYSHDGAVYYCDGVVNDIDGVYYYCDGAVRSEKHVKVNLS